MVQSTMPTILSKRLSFAMFLSQFLFVSIRAYLFKSKLKPGARALANDHELQNKKVREVDGIFHLM
jgi:hypothetical protein